MKLSFLHINQNFKDYGKSKQIEKCKTNFFKVSEICISNLHIDNVFYRSRKPFKESGFDLNILNIHYYIINSKFFFIIIIIEEVKSKAKSKAKSIDIDFALF